MSILKELIQQAGADEIKGDEFRALRDATEFSQTECAAIFGMKQSSISRIERRGLKQGGQAYRLAFATIGQFLRNAELDEVVLEIIESAEANYNASSKGCAQVTLEYALIERLRAAFGIPNDEGEEVKA